MHIIHWVMPGVIFLGILASPKIHPPGSIAPDPKPCELVILADPSDPYYPLAQAISAAEHASLASTWMDALACQPIYIIWVVSPGRLSDEAMVEFGLAMKTAPIVVSSGIITGSTIEQAHDLWQRRSQIQVQISIAANASNPSANIREGFIQEFRPTSSPAYPLSHSSFISALQSADYLTFTGHGGSGYLRLDEATQIRAEDIPDLDMLIVGTGSCQTIRPWNPGSIALQFVDQGAAAYAGFVFSPNEGYLIGEFNGLPFRYTWPDFPIGHAVQAQSRGTLQGFAHFPYIILLGDPRLALQEEPPYKLAGDIQAGETRTLTYSDAPAGVIPVHITGGAAYRFVQALGITTASTQDPFYNSRLQMVDIRADKFILVQHPGGVLRLRLQKHIPWHWLLTDILLDSLDHTLIFSQQSGGAVITLGFSALPIAWILWQGLKKRLNRQSFRLVFLIASSAVLFEAVYIVLRLDRLTIISKPVAFNPLNLAAVLICTACGALLYLQARTWRGKGLGILVMTFNTGSPMLMGLLIPAAYNWLFFSPEFDTPLYNLSLGWIAGPSFLVATMLGVGIMEIMRRQLRRNVPKSQPDQPHSKVAPS